MTRRIWSLLAFAVLVGSWFGPMPDAARHSFAAHMTMHIAVVAVAAPLLALAVAGTRADPVRTRPDVLAPIPLAMLELIGVWVWHVPALHLAARLEAGAFVLEQSTFLVTGFALWVAVLGGDYEQRRLRAGAGVVALLFTSMHMTLLGALFAMASRPLFHHGSSTSVADALTDQHAGGVIMLLVGGASYLMGGLGLASAALRSRLGTAPGRGGAAL